MIPPFDPVTGALPPDIHQASWAEVVARYSYNPVRRRLLVGLYMALEGLRVAECSRAYLGGSFVTAKPEPRDFDLCWDVTGFHETRLHFIFAVGDNDRQMQRDVFDGEIFPAHWIADSAGNNYLQFFQQNDKIPVGIIALDPGGLP